MPQVGRPASTSHPTTCPESKKCRTLREAGPFHCDYRGRVSFVGAAEQRDPQMRATPQRGLRAPHHRHADAGVYAALWVPSTTANLDATDNGYQVGGFKRDTTTLVMQARLPPGMRRHDDVVRTSIASASRAGDEPVPAVRPEPGLTGWVMVEDDVAVAGAWSFPAQAGLRDLRRRDRAGEAPTGPGATPGGARAGRCLSPRRADCDPAIDADGAEPVQVVGF